MDSVDTPETRPSREGGSRENELKVRWSPAHSKHRKLGRGGGTSKEERQGS